MSTPLRIAGVPEHFNLPFHLALEEGLVDFTWTDYPGGTGAMTKALRDGETDIAILLTEGIVADRAKGNSAHILGFFVESPLIWGIHTGAKTGLSSLSDTKKKVFAISRKGSGSHLMAYLVARRESWKEGDFTFVEVGNLEGARRALVEGEASLFLWERFMTQPLVDAGDLARIGEIPTPWPAFAIAVRREVWNDRKQEVITMMNTVLDRAHQLKSQPNAAQLISNRFGLKEDQVSEWLGLTHWGTLADEQRPDRVAPAVEAELRAVGAI